MEDTVSRRNSITRRLSLIVGGALVAAVLVVGSMALLEQRRQLTRALETKATSLAQFMAQVSPISVLSLNFVEMNNNVKKVVLTDDEAVYAIIVNDKGIPLASYLKDADPAVSDEARALWGGRSPQAAIEAMKRSTHILEVEAPIKAGEKPIGSATVGFTFERMHRALMVQIALIGTILIVVTGASLLLLVLVLRRILQPVQALTSAATQISTGDLNVVLTGTERSDELGVLSRAFGSMATQLRGLIAGMEQRMSELQRMGQALQKSEEEFRRIVATANEGIWVLDADVRTTFVNARMAEMLGYSGEEMMGRPFTDFMFEEDTPDHLERTGRRRQGRSETYERRFHCKDGQTMWALVSATPVFDDQHRYQGSFGMFTDITERRRAEEALRESEQRYRLVFENSPVSIWEEDFSGVKSLFDDLKKEGVSDIETHFARHPEIVLQCADLARIVDVNRAALTLHAAANKEELLAGLVNTFTPESFDTFRQELVRLWNGETGMTGDAVVKTLAGVPRNVTVYYSVCPGYEETLSKVLVSLADITERKQAEEGIRQSEEKYRTLIQKIRAAVVVHGADTQILTSNSMAQELLGLTEDQLLGKMAVDPAWHFFREDGTAAALDEYPVNRVLTSRRALNNCILGVHRPNQENDVWVLVNGDPVFGKEGEVAQVIVTFIDITERKRVESALAQREYEYRTLAENSPDVIVRYDREGRRIYVNPEFERVNRLTAQQALGKTPAELSTELLPKADQFMEKLMEAMDSGTAAKIDLSWSKDGKPVYWFVRVVPEFDAAGKVTSALTIWSDISERKIAEEEIHKLNAELEQRVRERTRQLAASEERMRQFFERQLVGMAITSPEKGWLHVNDKICEMLGYSREELTRLSWAEMTYPEDLAPDVAQFERMLRGEIDNYMLEKRFVRKDGSIVFTNLAVGCVRRTDRSVDYVLALLEDITERKRAEESILKLNVELQQRARALEDANLELESFSYSVSHDLRTPLRAIDGFAHILLDDYAGKLDEEGKRLLKVVRDNTSRMGQLIDDMLKFSRTGRVELTFSGIDMEGMAHAVFEELQPSIGTTKPQLEIEHLPPARGDSAMMRQVFVNLLTNAIKFSRLRDPAKIKVGGAIKGDEAVYYVKDNGVGFDMQYVDKLFGVFQRLHGVTEFEGTGIGLAIVKRIVTRHGGRVWAEGKPNEGATIYFALPAKETAHG